MNQNNSKLKIGFVILIIAFALYEITAMTVSALRAFDTGSTIMFPSVLALFVILMASIVFLRKQNSNAFLSFPVIPLMIYIYIITYILSLDKSLGSRYLYFEMLIPLMLYIGMKRYLGGVKERFLAIFLLCVFIGIILSYVWLFNKIHEFTQFEANYSLNVMTISYSVLYTLPFVLSFKKKYLVYIGLFTIFLAILFSYKRGPLVAFVVGVALYAYASLTSQTRKKKTLLLVVIVALVLYEISSSFFLGEGEYFAERLESMGDTGGSSRMKIYGVTIDMILNSSFLQVLFGHGWDSVVANSPLGFSAHNDFLEVMYDFGVFAFLLYVALYFRLIKLYLLLKRCHSDLTPAFLASIGVFIISSSVSIVVIYPYSLSFFMVYWSYVEVKLLKEKKKINY